MRAQLPTPHPQSSFLSNLSHSKNQTKPNPSSLPQSPLLPPHLSLSLFLTHTHTHTPPHLQKTKQNLLGNYLSLYKNYSSEQKSKSTGACNNPPTTHNPSHRCPSSSSPPSYSSPPLLLLYSPNQSMLLTNPTLFYNLAHLLTLIH
jgi:hypothetical protein